MRGTRLSLSSSSCFYSKPIELRSIKSSLNELTRYNVYICKIVLGCIESSQMNQHKVNVKTKGGNHSLSLHFFKKIQIISDIIIWKHRFGAARFLIIGARLDFVIWSCRRVGFTILSNSVLSSLLCLRMLAILE